MSDRVATAAEQMDDEELLALRAKICIDVVPQALRDTALRYAFAGLTNIDANTRRQVLTVAVMPDFSYDSTAPSGALRGVSVAVEKDARIDDVLRGFPVPPKDVASGVSIYKVSGADRKISADGLAEMLDRLLAESLGGYVDRRLVDAKRTKALKRLANRIEVTLLTTVSTEGTEPQTYHAVMVRAHDVNGARAFQKHAIANGLKASEYARELGTVRANGQFIRDAIAEAVREHLQVPYASSASAAVREKSPWDDDLLVARARPCVTNEWNVAVATRSAVVWYGGATAGPVNQNGIIFMRSRVHGVTVLSSRAGPQTMSSGSASRSVRNFVQCTNGAVPRGFALRVRDRSAALQVGDMTDDDRERMRTGRFAVQRHTGEHGTARYHRKALTGRYEIAEHTGVLASVLTALSELEVTKWHVLFTWLPGSSDRGMRLGERIAFKAKMTPDVSSIDVPTVWALGRITALYENMPHTKSYRLKSIFADEDATRRTIKVPLALAEYMHSHRV